MSLSHSLKGHLLIMIRFVFLFSILVLPHIKNVFLLIFSLLSQQIGDIVSPFFLLGVLISIPMEHSGVTTAVFSVVSDLRTFLLL